MRLGIHLPQWGRAATATTIREAAVRAEEQGWDDVWVSDHIAVPDGTAFPPAYLFEPLTTLTWAAASTTRVGLGTSVLVLPMRHPLILAKELACLDQLAGGRLVVGAAAGFLQGEFDALGVPFDERGARTDDAIDALRACWDPDDPVTFDGRHHHWDAMKVRPKPAHRVPIWVGGSSAPALRRAVTKGDGWHGSSFNGTLEATAALVAQVRAERPDEDFTVSIRVTWDGLRTAEDEIHREFATYADAGVQHFVVVPQQGDPEGWVRSTDRLWQILSSLT